MGRATLMKNFGKDDETAELQNCGLPVDENSIKKITRGKVLGVADHSPAVGS